MKKTIQQINHKIKDGKANILTAEEVTQLVMGGDEPTAEDVDVVTTGTCGIMSGTAAIFHIPVAEPGTFKKAKSILLNGVPGFPGPCPNEWLGSVDLMIYGTAHSINDPQYGGGFLFKELVSGKEIEIEAEDFEGNIMKSTATLNDFGTAQLIGTRSAFKNYTAFVNPSPESVKSIFNAVKMDGPFKGITFSGCGELNPLQNDPQLNSIHKGSKLLINNSEGLFIGTGTRSSPEKPNMMITADMKEMDPHYIGGFRTGAGPEVYNSVATAIPVLDDNILQHTFVKNEDISLPIADIRGRHSVLSQTDYGVWRDVDERPTYEESLCQRCETCLVEDRCPTKAFQNHELNKVRCFGCGMCVYSCPFSSFQMETGTVSMDWKGEIKTLDVICRQSDIKRARELARELKNRIINGEFIVG
ncbi:methanogenesis marker 16 metalloprotein [Methanobacterium petrolearium]|uniref:methanogenesis marker 16 metalloprotein n=1 Tax=Methanobacterium petrolearium TaxID=710190 RepID=UPI001AE92815|nr:methanogenesis marker 16 metalloprotein [Methanobacterium petrolearium]MBP1946158.1 putative methanogenesis marker 16 metalloprotein [Methanobacterium petrolearium]